MGPLLSWLAGTGWPCAGRRQVEELSLVLLSRRPGQRIPNPLHWVLPHGFLTMDLDPEKKKTWTRAALAKYSLHCRNKLITKLLSSLKLNAELSFVLCIFSLAPDDASNSKAMNHKEHSNWCFVQSL